MDRKNIRLTDYDYTANGYYFVTLCTVDRAEWMGDVHEGKFRPSREGDIVADGWKTIPEHHEGVRLDVMTLMPNHLHAIVIIDRPVGARRASPAQRPGRRPQGTVGGSLGAIIGSFKSVSARLINEHRGTPGVPVWQRNYFEHIVRNDREHELIREYIMNNPLQWSLDRENPRRTTGEARLAPTLELRDILGGVLP